MTPKDQPVGKVEKVEDKETERKKREEKNEQQRQKEMKEYKEEQDKKDKTRKQALKKQPYKLPLWIRGGNLIFGLVFMGLSILALSYEETALASAILIFGIILALSGLSRFINAFYDKEIGGTKRLFRFTISVILILLAISVFLSSTLGNDFLFVLLGIGLFFQGIGRVFLGLTHEVFPAWLKISQLLMGAVSAIVGIAATLPGLLDIRFEISTLILLVIGFFVSGLSRFSMGLVGLGATKRTE